MRLLSIMGMVVMLGACGRDPQTQHYWFKTYQTDRTCRDEHALSNEDAIRGPTGRTHPF